MMQLETEEIDILIIGAGPAGISAALHLVQLDEAWSERMLVVDRAIYPREKLCGGGITHLGENVLHKLGLNFEPTNFPVREVRLVYEDKSYSFRGNPVFRIVHRAEFDYWFLRQAEARGVEVRQGEAVEDVIPHEGYVEVITDRKRYLAQAVVAADGSRSTVRIKLKWNEPQQSHVARLLEVLTPDDERTAWEFRDRVAVFDFTPMKAGLQGYYWDFPSIVQGNKQMNRGVFDSRARPERPKANLKHILKNAMAKRERKLEDYKLKGHPIRWFDKRGPFSAPRILLAGDAAGVDPLFGEGISLALGYGPVAAAALADAFTRQDFSFSDYRRRILRDTLLWQLRLRTRLARFAYLLNYPWLVRFGWSVMRFLLRFSQWSNPELVPADTMKEKRGRFVFW